MEEFSPNLPAPFYRFNVGPMHKAKKLRKTRYLKVVCGLFTNGNSILLFKKKENGVWEFPGGKVEKNEPYKAALRRELEEELKYVGREKMTYFGSVRGLAGDRKIILRAYKIQEMPKAIILSEHSKVTKMDLTGSALKRFLRFNVLGDLDHQILLRLI